MSKDPEFPKKYMYGFALMLKNRLHIIIPEISPDRYSQSPLRLSAADVYLENEIELTYEDYLAYQQELTQLSEACSNLTYELDPSPAFHNINITIAGGKMVIVSKEKSPAIHFVIRHKMMIRAFSNFIPPIVE